VRLNGGGWLASAARLKGGRALLMAAGIGVLAGLLAANDAPAVGRAVADAGWRVLAPMAAHVPIILTAAIGWIVLLPAGQRPGLVEGFRLRWIKEAVNGLLPVAQIGGDVVRARLAAGPALPLKDSAASCIVDAAIAMVSLVLFLAIGLACGVVALDDPRLLRMGAPLVAAGVLLVLLLTFAGRLGVLKLVDRVAALSRRAFGPLEGMGEAVAELTEHHSRIARSIFWHLAAWLLGVAETSAALWAIGLDASLDRALILESTAQAARALGFLVPGALGVQEGGYLAVSGMLGMAPDQALALSLLRRARELALGSIGLLAWRLSRPRSAAPMQPTPADPSRP
jgi:putative membrane protein